MLNDYTLAAASPSAWANKAVEVFHQWHADCLVAEVNQGGDMVETILRSIDANLPVKQVRATRGKWLRAEPVAALYEQDRVFHAGSFPLLEDQMCDFGRMACLQGVLPTALTPWFGR